ncbi:MAG: sigma-70 family RNA polymerase sigma factor, partial [Planctomycetota bacterium]|nr:sigma-70 family RNA polymerase sigma factor [Planctomycetota bacterium]
MSDNNQWTGAGEGLLSMEALLQHESFVRSVVRRLISDEAAVQDVVQSTWVQALEHPPVARHGDRSIAAWLARVATNLVRSRQRSEGRRTFREGAVAREERDDSWEESVERLESRQRVVEVVLGLGEPYRSVVMLRYEKGLSVDQIAHTLQRGAGTIRSQLSRAHAILRSRLDGEFEDRNSWALLALPMGAGVGTAGGDGRAAPMESGPQVPSADPVQATPGWAGVAVGTKAALVVLLASGVLLAGWWQIHRSSAGNAQTPIVSTHGEPELQAPVALASLDMEQAERGSVEVAPEPVVPEVSAWAGPPPETMLPRAHLLSQSKYRNYVAATFSFEYGTRDDPGDVVRNDWDLKFSDRGFRVNTVTDDRSQIFDLGKVRLADVHPGLLDGAKRATETFAPTSLGHSYVVWTRDSETDLVHAFEVVGLEPGDHCELDWYTVNGNGQASGSFHDDGVGPYLVETFRAVRDRHNETKALAHPRILLQARAGHQGGNPCQVNALGEANAYFD